LDAQPTIPDGSALVLYLRSIFSKEVKYVPIAVNASGVKSVILRRERLRIREKCVENSLHTFEQPLKFNEVNCVHFITKFAMPALEMTG
jgi:hypothetical protein